MFKRFSVLRNLLFVCVVVAATLGGAGTIPVAAASGIAPLNIKNPSNVYPGGVLYRCVGDGSYARKWVVTSDIHWATYERDISIPWACGTPRNGVYPLMSQMNLGLGTWITQCRSSHPGEQFVFKTLQRNIDHPSDYSSISPFQYYETNPLCY